jgi:hypothetical protein
MSSYRHACFLAQERMITPLEQLEAISERRQDRGLFGGGRFQYIQHRASGVQAFYSVRPERLLMERLEYDPLFRWFVGIGVDDAAWDHSVFSKNRDRLCWKVTSRRSSWPRFWRSRR